MTKKFTIFCISLALLLAPLLSNSQVVSGIIQQAQEDAERETNGCLWAGAGFITCGAVLLFAFISKPYPPLERLMGKSPEYVEVYTRAYQQKAQSIRIVFSAIGLLGCIAVGNAFFAENQ